MQDTVNPDCVKNDDSTSTTTKGGELVPDPERNSPVDYIDARTDLYKIHSHRDAGSIAESPLKDMLQEEIDGGYGWAVAAAGFLANFVMFGVGSTWGLFSQAYATSILEGKASTLELMTVGPVLNISLNLFTPVSVSLVRYGTRFNYFLGSALMCLAIILAGFSTEAWHLYLTQGLLFGFGASFLYMSIASVIPQWFTTRRATAMGICSAGTGLGGLALSPMASFLISKYGMQWAYHILGFFSLGICCVGTILLSMFKLADFDIWLIGSVIVLMGYLTPIFYLPKYAADIGLSQAHASNILAIFCAVNAIGRIGLGIVADKIGRLNMFIISSILASVFSFAIWPLASSYNLLLAYYTLFGLTCGTYYVLAAPLTGSIVGMEKLSSGLSIAFVVSAIAAMGTPISAAIQQSSADHGYFGIQMFVGSVYVGGALICLCLKHRLTGSLLSKY